mmetsp:Transcript_20162/g.29924  ORF Transcript_20162/g.29924 Transcript_20162/m.29924 type:complete len:560 (-) Transcript_20162:1000-2679(-)
MESKRRKVSSAAAAPPSSDNGDDENTLLQLMLQRPQQQNGDEDEDAARQRRREERRKRYKAKLEQNPNGEDERAVPEKLSQVRNEESSLPLLPTDTYPSHLQKEDKEEKDEGEGDDDDDDDDFDMFSSSVSPINPTSAKPAGDNEGTGPNRKRRLEDAQDAEGYYRAVLGETLEIDTAPETKIPYKVLGVVGKGVFSTVLKCTNTKTSETVALKMIRNNETMARVAQDEVRFLQTLQSHPHVVSLLLPQCRKRQDDGTGSSSSATVLEHYGHVVLVFPFLPYNLRDVLKKFGKGVGLSLTGVAQYFQQLLSALLHCQKHRIIHADLKPDNILVSADFSICQICDFGSAMEGPSEQDATGGAASSSAAASLPTPYLVSRFYRAPEVMLGVFPVTYAIDLWSIAVTVVELFLGKLWLGGRDNNEMLHSMMERLGPFPPKTLKQHYVSLQKYSGFQPHFVYKAPQHFWVHPTTDPITNRPIVREVNVSSQTFPNPKKTLSRALLGAKSAKDARHYVQQFCDLLMKCLSLDATKRISVRNAMHHAFFKSIQESNSATTSRASG